MWRRHTGGRVYARSGSQDKGPRVQHVAIVSGKPAPLPPRQLPASRHWRNGYADGWKIGGAVMMQKTWQWLGCGAALAPLGMAGRGGLGPPDDGQGAAAARVGENGDITPPGPDLQHRQAVQPWEGAEDEI